VLYSPFKKYYLKNRLLFPPLSGTHGAACTGRTIFFQTKLVPEYLGEMKNMLEFD